MQPTRYPGECLEDLSALLAGAEGGPAVPTRRELEALLDAAFFASMHEEEAQRVVFEAVFLRREEAAARGWSAFEFERPLPLEPRRVAKLALATTAGRTAVAVEPRGEEELVLWGLVSLPPRGLTTRGPLVLRVRGPGIFSIEVHGETVFRYVRGVLTRAGSGGAPAILGRLREAHPELAPLASLARRIAERGHGGAVFLFTQDPSDFSEGFDELRYRVGGSAAGVLARAAKSGAVDDAALLLAGLASVDGAVLLAKDFRVLAFGAFVRSPSGSDRLALIDAQGRSLPRSTLKGARHKSALWFCQTWPGALALVVSQDGDVSLYWRVERGVLAERDLAVGALTALVR